MFWKKGYKYYENLLSAEDDARQIRTLKNKVLASNPKGLALFGNKENVNIYVKYI